MNIQNDRLQQLKDTYMVLSAKLIGQESEPTPINFDTFSKLMSDNKVVNSELSRNVPINFTTNEGVKPKDLPWSLEIDKLISKAYEKGLMNKSNILISNDNISSQNILKYSNSTNLDSTNLNLKV